MVGPPRFSARLFGRDVQLKKVAGALEGHGGLWTLVGPGGVGKTRLAAALASAWTGTCWWVDLQAVQDAAGLERAVSHGMGLTVASEPLQSMADRGRALIVLDNFEQLDDDCAKCIDGWIRVARSLRVLVTSRECLNLTSEEILEVEPLTAKAAAQVFLAATPSTFDENSCSSEILNAILGKLEGLPLALELAAARLDILSLSQLGKRLEDPLAVLKNPATGRGRHDGLASTISWSWDLLTESERSVLAQVAVFRGGFTLHAAEQIVDTDADVLDRLHRLRLRRLLTFDGQRFGMLEVIRRFALQASDTQEVCARRDAYFAALAIGAVAEIDTPSARRALDTLSVEYDNLHSVLEGGSTSDALAAGEALGVVLEHRGPAGAQLPVINRVLERCLGRPETRARLLRQRAAYLEKRGRTEDARADLHTALEGVEHVPDLAARVRVRLADLHVYEGDSVAAEQVYRRALDDASGNPDLEASILIQMATIAQDDGRLDEALRLEEQSLALARSAENPYRIAKVLGSIASLATEREDLDRSRSYGQEALAIFESLNIPRSVTFTTGNLGLVAEVSGALDLAEAHYRQAVQGARDAQDKRLIGIWTGFLGRVYVARGDAEEGRRKLLEAIELLEEAGASRFVSVFDGCLALEAATRKDEAETLARAARVVSAEDLGRAMCAVAVEVVRSRVASEAADSDVALAHLAAAEEIYAEHRAGKSDHGLRQMRVLMDLARSEVDAWVIATDGSWFRPPGGEKVPVKGAQAGVLACLLSLHGTGSAQVEDLVAAGWPDERISAAAATNRVYVALTGLRKLGLRELLVGARPGWRLNPAVMVRPQ